MRHEGAAFTVDAELRPGPHQVPRPPIWVAAMSGRRPLARAVRYDGVAAVSAAGGPMTPDEVARVVAELPPHPDGFDVVVPRHEEHGVAAYAAAGATWLTEGRWPEGDWYEELAERVARGPHG